MLLASNLWPGLELKIRTLTIAPDSSGYNVVKQSSPTRCVDGQKPNSPRKSEHWCPLHFDVPQINCRTPKEFTQFAIRLRAFVDAGI
jgi:hypothetical protein